MAALDYTVRRSARASRARILVSPDGVEVVVPRRVDLRGVAELVEAKRPWIERTLRRQREAGVGLARAELRDGGQVPYLGEVLALAVRVDPGAAPRVIRRADRLEAVVGSGDRVELEEALERWYRARAREEVAVRLDAAVACAGRRYDRLAIRNQRTRWASCSSSGTMSFNWRLLLAPEPILLYVVEHEVAHLDVPDHSARFWALLAERVPTYREHEGWLRRHGSALRL